MIKYKVTDDEFNKTWFPDLIGREFDIPPSYMKVDLIDPEFEALKKKQSIPNGTQCQFNWLNNEELIGPEGFPNWGVAKSYDGLICLVISLETFAELGERDHEYYNVKFEDGYELAGLSGYHLTPIKT